MKFVGLLSLLCVFCLAVTLFDSTEAKIKRIKIAKKVAKLLFLRSAIRPKVVLAVPVPVPIPIIRKTVQSASAWGEAPTHHSSTSYEIPSLTSLPESILNLLRPALSTIAASAMRGGNNQAWSVNNMPELNAWSPPVESWPSAPMEQNAWPATSSRGQVSQQQQEVVEQQQTNNYA